MYKIGICDDCQEDIERMRQIILSNWKSSDKVIIYEYLSGKELLKDADKEHNLIFIDMQMPQTNGIQTALELRRQRSDVIIVFCSGLMQPTPENFKVQPFRYLEKQLPKQDMQKEIQVILHEMERKASIPYLIAQYDGKTVRVRVDQIIYASIHNKATKLFITKEEAERLKLVGEKDNNKIEVICNKRLAEVWTEINRFGFGYAHNSYIVNFKYIVRKDKYVIKLENNVELNCSRSREPVFSKQFEAYLTHVKTV